MTWLLRVIDPAQIQPRGRILPAVGWTRGPVLFLGSLLFILALIWRNRQQGFI